MTCIAYDGVTLAADRRMTAGTTISQTYKLHRANDGAIMGGCGHVNQVYAMFAWYDDGADPEKFPKHDDEDSELLIVRPDGKTYAVHRNGHLIPVTAPFSAIGSGAGLALVAMHCDRTAAEAVQIASIYDMTCGDGVDTLTLTRR